MAIDDFMIDEASLALARAIHRYGLVAPSLRQIADLMNTVPGTLLHHFGSKDRVLAFSADRLAQRSLRALRTRTVQLRWDGFMPDPNEADDIFLTRARLALAEIARGLPAAGPAVDRARREERWLIWEVAHERDMEIDHDDPLLSVAADALVGLWEAVCNPEPPLPVAAARERWSAVVSMLRSRA